MTKKTRRVRGFTLVELLVVITIIGMLMALLLPAVGGAVESARRIACSNKQKQLALAINTFESQKKRYPGYDNAISNNVHGSWVVAILPYMERNDVYDEWANGNAATPYMDMLICNSDPPESTSGPICSYVINAGYNTAGTAYETPANGIAHDYFDTRVKTTADYITNCDGTTNTLLLSENVSARKHGGWNIFNDKIFTGTTWFNSENVTRKINGRNVSTQRSLTDVPLGTSIAGRDAARPSSFHPGGAVVAYCDGHIGFLRQQIGYPVYAQLMTPCAKESNQMPAAWKAQLLDDGDLE